MIFTSLAYLLNPVAGFLLGQYCVSLIIPEIEMYLIFSPQTCLYFGIRAMGASAIFLLLAFCTIFGIPPKTPGTTKTFL